MSAHRNMYVKREGLGLVTREDIETELKRRAEKEHKAQVERLNLFSDAELKEWLGHV